MHDLPVAIAAPRNFALEETGKGTDLQELFRVSPEFLEKMRALPELIDVTTDLLITSPQLMIDIDRDKASTLGITAQQIEDTLYNAFGSRQVSTIYTPTNQYFVILEAWMSRACSSRRSCLRMRLTRLRRCFGPKPSACEPTIETSVVIDDSELLCHEQLVALDNFLDHFAFRIEPKIG